MAYATVDDLNNLVKEEMMMGLTEQDKQTALNLASAEADPYLASQFKLPLVSWGQGLRNKICQIALWYLLRRRGFKPGGGEYELCRLEYEDSLSFFRQISSQRICPPDIIDSSPSTYEYQVGIATSELHGW